MKKKLALLAVMACILTACTPADIPEAPPAENPPPVEAPAPEKKLIRHDIGKASDTYNLDFYVYSKAEFDFDRDGIDDTVRLLTSATVENGELLGDDGNEWQLVVETENGAFLLYDSYIQLGSAEIDIGEIYFENPEGLIILTLTTGASKSITHYTFRDGAFYEELVYTTDGLSEYGINLITNIHN